MFKWIKKGLIFSPSMVKDIIGGGYDMSWMHSHAQIPFAVHHNNFVRVYFATREQYKNKQVKAYGGYVDIDKKKLNQIINISKKPIIDLGELGDFDEHGSMPCSVIKQRNQYWLYYVGWSRRHSVPYDWEIGLAISNDNGISFKKYCKGPIVGPTATEPYLNSTPIVYKISDLEYHMFYHTGVKWITSQDGVESHYTIRHATSKDGINWIRSNCEIIQQKLKNECQTSPSIIKINNCYHMFFCYREGLDFRENKNKSYRIGYAYSNDLINWIRDDDKAGIDVSDSGWDSQMICYPHITKINNKYIMFYCGNNFGKDGFGYAELELNEGF